MEYSKIVSVTGLPGLYELINTKTDGAIVRSLDDKSTKFASSRVHSFSHLESIEVFTTGENVNLAEVFQAMEKAGGSLPDSKDNGAVKKYFEKVYPDIDFERVYSSDLKKMIKWFDVLKKNNVDIKLTEPEPEEETQTEQVKAEAVKEAEKAKTEKASQAKKPKQAAKKKTEKKEKEDTKAAKKAKPAKKAAQKKK
jgi:uncharacterized protein DUF6852/uncharacterized protein DUF5606